MTAPEACPDGSRPDLPGPAGQQRPRGTSLAAAMDRESVQVVVMDQEHGEVWTLDVCTNTYAKVPAGTGRPEELPRFLVYADAVDLLFTEGEGRVATFDVDENVWADLRLPEDMPVTPVGYDPDSQSVLYRHDRTAAVWAYRTADERWAELHPGLPALRGSDVRGRLLWTYDAARQEVLVARYAEFAGSSGVEQIVFTYALGLAAGRWTVDRGGYDAPAMGSGPRGHEIAFDAATSSAAVFSEGALAVRGPDGTGWVYSEVPEGPGIEERRFPPTGALARLGGTLVSDPVNERLVLVGGFARLAAPGEDPPFQTVVGDEVWAYDVGSDTWTGLVEAGPVVPTPYA